MNYLIMNALEIIPPFRLSNSSTQDTISPNYTYDLPLFGKIKSVMFAGKITNVVISRSEKIFVGYNNFIKILIHPEYNTSTTIVISSYLIIKFLTLLNDILLIFCTNDNNIQIWKQYKDIFIINHQFKGPEHKILQMIPMINNQFGYFTKDNSITILNI